MNELKSYTEYAVSTPTADFVIGFDFNYGEDAVNVTVDDVPATEAGYTVVYLNETTIRLSPSVPSGVVRLQRETDIDQTDHAYRAGAKFIAQTMDENFEQLRHSQQEVRDGFVKLAEDTYEIIDTLNEVGQSAQDAADAAEVAAELANNAAAQVNDKVSYEDFNNKPHNAMLARDAASAHPTSSILDASGETQQQVNYNGGSKWHSRVGGYLENERVILTNGDIVKSTVDGNTNDPNDDMTGWVNANDASLVKYGLQNQAQINARTATPYDHGAIGDGLAHPLSERYATLAAAQAAYPSATSLDEYIDGHAVNVWWRDVCANDRKYATCHGKFLCNTKISNVGINNINNTIKTKRIDFNADIAFKGLTGNGFEIISPRQCEFSGFINIYDVGGVTYTNRNIDNLVYMEDFIHGVFKWKVVAKYAKHLGLMVFSGAGSLSGGYANNNTSDLGDWQFGSCGHRFKHNSFTFTARSDTGSTSSTGQRSVLTLSAPHNLGDLVDSFIRFSGKPYLVTASTANSLTVYPWISENDATGTIEISKGGDFKLDGADSNNIKMSGGSSDCAICAGDEGFYVGVKIQRTNQANDIGLRLGNGVSSSQIGGVYLGLYVELNEFDIVRTSSTVEYPIIIKPIALRLPTCHILTPIDITTRKASANLVTSFVVWDGDKILKQKKGQFYNGVNSSTALNATIGDDSFRVRGNTATITLKDEVDIRRLFGNCDVEFEVFGSASNNGTTGITTIKCDAGYTINNIVGDLVIPSSNSAFKVSARLVNETDWRVYIFYAEKPKGSKVFDWSSLAAATQQSTTVTVTGAVVGNTAVASMDVALNGSSLRAEVTALNTVTVYQFNPTASPVDVASGTLSVKII